MRPLSGSRPCYGEFSTKGFHDVERTASNVFIRRYSRRNLLDAAFAQVARDGAGTIEVAVRLRSALAALATADDPRMRQAAQDMAALALSYSENAGLLDSEMEKLRRIEV